jgi:hypothetical protein
MHSVKAFAHMLRVPQHDILRDIGGEKFIFRTGMETTSTKAKNPSPSERG